MPLFSDSVAVGSNPVHAVPYGTKIYVANADSNTVSVIDTIKKEVTSTIPVGVKPLSLTLVGEYIYVGNSEGSTITVIDTYKDQVNMTINIPKGLKYIFSSGLYIYALGNDHITVVDSTKNTIARTITTKWTVGTQFPTFYTLKNRVFVHHPNDTYLTILYSGSWTGYFYNLGFGVQASSLLSTNLYAINSQLRQVQVLQADSLRPVLLNNLPITIPVGRNPIQAITIGSKIYVNNSGDNTVSVIDTFKNVISKTIPVGTKPIFMTVYNRIVFVFNADDNTISVIDTSTDTVVKVLNTGAAPVFGAVQSDMLYSLNTKSNSVSIFDIDIPKLLEITTTSTPGTYIQGATITIKASFDAELAVGSSMRLMLNTDRTILLDTVNGKNITGVYTVWSGENTAKLNVKYIDFANINNSSDIPGISYTIPDKKNIWDLKTIVIDTSKTSVPIATPESMCSKNSSLYRLCPLSKAPENTLEYRENMICEWFVSEDQSHSKRISRIEVLNIAVNMFRGPITPAADYTNTYSDITAEWNSQETVSVIQTGLDNGLIFPNNGAFEPTKKISRIEAYALLMRGVCMSPVEGQEDMARAIHQKAIQEGITTKQWARFRPQSSITRNEVFIVASALADWADKHGGCDKLECRK